jgi:hypothetical protein
LLQTLQAGIRLRRQLLSTINRQQCRERLQRFKALKRKRMDTPKSKEVSTSSGTGYQTTLMIHGRRKTEQRFALESWVYGHKQRHLTLW